MAKVLHAFVLLGMLIALTFDAFAGSYTLKDGQTLTGEPVSYDKNGVVIKLPNGSFAPRTAWDKFSQESLHELKAEAKRPQDAEFIEPFFEHAIQEEVQLQSIQVKPVDRLERPTGKTGIFAGLGSPLWLAIMLVLYAGNIYGGYAVSQFKNMPPAVGCGIAAVLPFVGPIILLFVPARLDFIERQQADQMAEEAAAAAAAAEPAPQAEPLHEQHPVEEVPPATHTHPATSRPDVHFSLPSHPVSAPAPAQPTVTFRRGEFTFNRRFFETKMPGFFRVVPSDEEKDLVLAVKSLRGEFVAKRIPKITQTDLHLETFKGEATAEEVIPFVEIQEVQIRHKDAV